VPPDRNAALREGIRVRAAPPVCVPRGNSGVPHRCAVCVSALASPSTQPLSTGATCPRRWPLVHVCADRATRAHWCGHPLLPHGRELEDPRADRVRALPPARAGCPPTLGDGCTLGLPTREGIAPTSRRPQSGPAPALGRSSRRCPSESLPACGRRGAEQFARAAPAGRMDGPFTQAGAEKQSRNGTVVQEALD
jgi:hypothetical protein